MRVPAAIQGDLAALGNLRVPGRGGRSIPRASVAGLALESGLSRIDRFLLVEYAIVAMRDRSMTLAQALLDACHKRTRPIVMTTVAMIAGLLPIALGIGADASFRQPMAITVIGGLLTSTAL